MTAESRGRDLFIVKFDTAWVQERDGQETEYSYNVPKPPLRCVLWERNVGHSIRPGFADGFLFPYHEALALAAKGEGIDPEEVVASQRWRTAVRW